MWKLTLSAIVLSAVMAGCGTLAPGAIGLRTSMLGIEYTPGQIREVMRDLGYRPVKFKKPGQRITVYQWQDSTLNEMHFQSPVDQLRTVTTQLFWKTGELRVRLLGEPAWNEASEQELLRIKQALMGRLNATET